MSAYTRCTDTERRANNFIGTPMYYILLPMGYSVQWRVCRQSVQCLPYALYAGRRVMAACSSSAAVAILGVFELLHSCTFRVTPNFDLESDNIIRKLIVHRIQRCNPRREILSMSTFHTRVDHRSVRHFCIVLPLNCPFLFDDHHQNLIHPYRARPHSPPNPPCCHCSHVHTDRWDKRKLYPMIALLYRVTR